MKTTMHRRFRIARLHSPLIGALVAFAGLVGTERDAHALQGGEDASLLPVLVDKRFGQGGRHQTSVLFTNSLASKFVEATGGYVTYGYNFTDLFGLEVGGALVAGREAKIMQQVRAGIGSNEPNLTDLFQLQWMANVNFVFVPFYGKISFASVVDPGFDIYLLAGGGFAGVRKQKGAVGSSTFETATTPIFNAGLGFRFYITRLIALRVELRDYFFPEPTDSTLTAAEQRAGITHNLHVQAGVQLQFGGD